MTLDEKKYQRLLEAAVQGLCANTGFLSIERVANTAHALATTLVDMNTPQVPPPAEPPTRQPSLAAMLARLPDSESGEQAKFLLCATRLIEVIHGSGHYCTGGDLYRDPRAPYGSPTSNHRKRKAIDLNLFDSAGNYLSSTAAHEPYGIWWENLGTAHDLPLRWGGRFQDGNHYEWND